MPASEVMVMCETALDRYHTYYEKELQQRLSELRSSIISYDDIELIVMSRVKMVPWCID